MNKPSYFVAQIDLSLAEKLKRDLLAQGFEISTPLYTIFAAKKKNISCTLYQSGKLTVQGKEKDPFIEFYLEPEILGSFQFTHPEAHLDLTPHTGLDEAGKGDFFGPLCVAAVFADGEGIKQLSKWGVRDSKKLSDRSIASLAEKIRASYSYTVIRLFPAKYNELYEKFKNLNRLLAWAHTAALHDMIQKTGCQEATIDQFAEPYVMERAIGQKKFEVHLTHKIGGESDLVVAAASILARHGFVEGLKTLGAEWEMELPKGAGPPVTKAIEEFKRKWGKELLNKVSKTHFKLFH